MYAFNNRATDTLGLKYLCEEKLNLVIEWCDPKKQKCTVEFYHFDGSHQNNVRQYKDKIIVKRVNDLELFFLDDNMYKILTQIFDLNKIEYDSKYLKVFQIPISQNIDLTNENDLLNLANYYKLIKTNKIT